MIQPTSPGRSRRRLTSRPRLAVPQRQVDVAHRLNEAIAPGSVDRLEQGGELGPGRQPAPAKTFRPASVSEVTMCLRWLGLIRLLASPRARKRATMRSDAPYVERPADLRRGSAALSQFIKSARLGRGRSVAGRLRFRRPISRV